MGLGNTHVSPLGIAASACWRDPHVAKRGSRHGLRSSEWINAEILHDLDDGWKLKVQNGKSTNGRSHGPTRTLSWSGCSDEVLAVMDWLGHLENRLPSDPKQRRRHWNNYYDQLRDTLHEVCRELWPRRKRLPSFYSTRHTFAAAAKAVLTAAEVGALLGHGTDFTAWQHYARPPKGGTGLPEFRLPTPNPAEMSQVRKVLGERLSRATPLQARLIDLPDSISYDQRRLGP